MKLKELNRSATVAWSPTRQHASFMAAATVAGSLTVDFDTSGQLELFSTNLQKMGTEMTPLGRVQTKERLHKLVWSSHGSQTYKYGIIAGGLANGVINVWNPAPLIEYVPKNPVLLGSLPVVLVLPPF